MAPGVKCRQVTTRSAYTMEGFYDAIADKTFSAGKPSLIRSGTTCLVTFPALDCRNQVQILSAGTGKESRAFQVRGASEAGGRNVKNRMAAVVVNSGLQGWLQLVGRNAKRCEELVDLTALELRTINL